MTLNQTTYTDEFRDSAVDLLHNSGKPLKQVASEKAIKACLVGNPTYHLDIMELAVKKNYDAKLDAKRRLTIRNASTEFYHITEYEDGTVKLEPRVLVSPDMLEQIDAAVERHKAGHKGTKLDWSKLPEV